MSTLEGPLFCLPQGWCIFFFFWSLNQLAYLDTILEQSGIHRGNMKDKLFQKKNEPCSRDYSKLKKNAIDASPLCSSVEQLPLSSCFPRIDRGSWGSLDQLQKQRSSFSSEEWVKFLHLPHYCESQQRPLMMSLKNITDLLGPTQML